MSNPDPYARYIVKDMGENGRDFISGEEVPDTPYAVYDSCLQSVVFSGLTYALAVEGADNLNGNTAISDGIRKSNALQSLIEGSPV